jgi:threonine/homoserine/homoserine lactone efflux protein
MYKRLNELSFIIGLFFIILSVILIGGYLLSEALNARINLYSGICFLAFGIFMVWVKSGE